jgi:hypothetical protein
MLKTLVNKNKIIKVLSTEIINGGFVEESLELTYDSNKYSSVLPEDISQFFRGIDNQMENCKSFTDIDGRKKKRCEFDSGDYSGYITINNWAANGDAILRKTFSIGGPNEEFSYLVLSGNLTHYRRTEDYN